MADKTAVMPGAFEPRTPSQQLFNPEVVEGQWQAMLESDCTFEPEMFLVVMHNLIKNPNIMSTHLFRADILYDSDADHTLIQEPATTQFSDFTEHLKPEYQPSIVEVNKQGTKNESITIKLCHKGRFKKPMPGLKAQVTDPAKHVFEDLGIASFLIELWKDMYDCSAILDIQQPAGNVDKPPFPGFVDIGCGNGLLVNILIQEGFPGWGFDARHRKSWETFAPNIQSKLAEGILVPEVLDPQESSADDENVDDLAGKLEPVDLLRDRDFHNGLFKQGTFIVSNHADELTPWTPLLSYLNDSPFIAIPCCSHNLAGARWRAPISKPAKEKAAAQRRQESSKAHVDETDNVRSAQAAETGSLKKTAGTKNVQSAYASLCDYVSGLANDVNFVVETEILRIPSTRNTCILGRKTKATQASDGTSKEQHIRDIVARELNAPIKDICDEFVRCAQKLVGKKGEAH
ncbi:unnamed protein product [Aureobasidium pullulans]|nr:unnamed protein product [Aureobasidium pullulans]